LCHTITSIFPAAGSNYLKASRESILDDFYKISPLGMTTFFLK
jgi:hypothetical protein